MVTDGNQGGESALSWVRCREVSSQFPLIAVFSAPEPMEPMEPMDSFLRLWGAADGAVGK